MVDEFAVEFGVAGMLITCNASRIRYRACT